MSFLLLATYGSLKVNCGSSLVLFPFLPQPKLIIVCGFQVLFATKLSLVVLVYDFIAASFIDYSSEYEHLTESCISLVLVINASSS